MQKVYINLRHSES